MKDMTNEELAVLAKNDEKALELLITRNERLIHEIAKRFLKPNDQFYDDAIQEGRIAITRAIKYYNPEKARFSTYVWVYIRNAIVYFLQPFKRYLSLDATSLDTIAFVDIAMSPDPEPSLMMVVKDAVNQLNDREKTVVLRHYFFKENFATIANYMGYGRHNCSKLHKQAINKMKYYLSKDEGLLY